jgi:hypothetical protein
MRIACPESDFAAGPFAAGHALAINKPPAIAQIALYFCCVFMVAQSLTV